MHRLAPHPALKSRISAQCYQVAQLHEVRPEAKADLAAALRAPALPALPALPGEDGPISSSRQNSRRAGSASITAAMITALDSLTRNQPPLAQKGSLPQTGWRRKTRGSTKPSASPLGKRLPLGPPMDVCWYVKQA